MKDVVVAFIVSNNRVLAERRDETDDISPGKLRFPAGHVEKGEPFDHALKREVLEELGVRVTDYKKIHETTFTEGEETKRLHYFMVKFDGEIREAPFLHWLSRKDAEKMSFPDDKDLITWYLR